MILDIFATKIGMTQVWTKAGKRLAVTRCKILKMPVIGKRDIEVLDKHSQTRETLTCTILEVGFGKKKLKNMTKPLRTKMEKGGFSSGVKNIRGLRAVNDKLMPSTDTELKAGDMLNIDDVIEVGDMVKVQGVSKGRGFAGAMKRWNFHGGPKTHGQSDRARAVGSIGAGTTPGRVWPGKKMPGHYGAEAKTVVGLTVIHIDKDTNEVWISGPVPGSMMSDVQITKVGKKKKIELDYKASNIEVKEVSDDVSKQEAPKDKVNGEAREDDLGQKVKA